ncbi:immunity protein TriTu family protein [Paludibaculum fermentans]|uniref:Uncharacterized protein n=1 Tax=Paludibaculum fermentans TaxID=1473598 RepID=A0A7S7NPT6_PALFE|nr:hypothetical protein [Paludibaculum fermentans]QOY87074.1 hypothetical protein IRI77_30555 [Paludibaculum fermentans]
MMRHPLTLQEIICWYRSKKLALAGSDVSIVDIRERTDDIPAAAADFRTPKTMGRINGWVTGEFDFEAVRVPDGEDLFWHHASVQRFEALEETYDKFLQCMSNSGKVAGP